MRNISDLIDELKRRRVFRVLIAYAVTAFVIIQIADIVFPALHLPEWTLTLVVVLLGIGFPVSFGLAWAFDLTDKGIVKTPRGVKPTKGSVKSHPIFSNKTLAVITAIAIIIAGWGWIKSPPTGEDVTQSDDKSIAVLPFTNFSSSEEDAYFADGIHDDILTQLSKIRDLKVISRTSVMHYRETTKLLPVIAEELGVINILEGSVRRSGNRVRIVAQLVNAKTDKHLWAETYDRNYADIFEIQSEVAQKIASALKSTLSPEEKALIEVVPTTNMEAYDYFLRGNQYWNNVFSKESHLKAVAMYKKASELDPKFGLAYARLSFMHSLIYLNWDSSEKRMNLARATLEKALTLAPDHPEIHFAQATFYEFCQNDRKQALVEYELAFNGQPNDSKIVNFVGRLNLFMGNWQEAEFYLLKANELEPHHRWYSTWLGTLYFYQSDYNKADEIFRVALNSNPEFAELYFWYARLQLWGFGDINKARWIIEDGILSSDHPESLTDNRFWIEITARDYEAALKIVKNYSTEKFSSYYKGIVYFLMGREDLAKVELDSARIITEDLVLATYDNDDNAYNYDRLGLIYTLLGQKEEGIKAGKNAIELYPVDEDAIYGPDHLYRLAEIYSLTGDYEQAIDLLDELLLSPNILTPWSLKLNPFFDPLHDNPSFQALIEKYSQPDI